MMAETDGRAITRRGLLRGMTASAALGFSGELLLGADDASLDAEAIKRLVVAIDDVPTDKFEWGTLKWLVNAARFPGAEQTVGICQLFPAKRNPVHYHPNCEEVLYMMAGRGRHSLGEETYELTPGMAVRIPKNMHHNLVNTGWETILCLVTFSSGNRQTVFVN